jgi:hypothetical protein
MIEVESPPVSSMAPKLQQRQEEMDAETLKVEAIGVRPSVPE